jgi:hypothetical protein
VTRFRLTNLREFHASLREFHAGSPLQRAGGMSQPEKSKAFFDFFDRLPAKNAVA